MIENTRVWSVDTTARMPEKHKRKRKRPTHLSFGAFGANQRLHALNLSAIPLDLGLQRRLGRAIVRLALQIRLAQCFGVALQVELHVAQDLLHALKVIAVRVCVVEKRERERESERERGRIR